ncbi:MAG: response regulator, partial [Pseudomonadota bacterium]
MSSRVLVVDDNSTNRRLMQATLEAKYYTVMLAANGSEALAAALNFAPQVILLDIMMPGMDGYEVCRRLKSDDRTRHIPVVMLTALNDAEDRVRGLEAGADDFLSKPVAEIDLTARLDTLTRYYEVANELRQRSAPGSDELALTKAEQELLARPGGVLIIDGDKRSAKRIARPLKEAGHDAVVWDKHLDSNVNFNSGLGLVIVNLSDQKHDSLRLVAQLRSLYFDKYIAILVCFVRGDEKLALDALKLGANDVVMEPLNPAELLARVSTQLRRARYLDVLRQRVDRNVELSMIDQLTGLYNRRFMLEQLHRQVRRAHSAGQTLSVVALDIDHFKQVND